MVVKAAFAHRRKTLFNSLKDALSACSPEEILGALRQCGIDSHKRAEMLDIDDFLCLSAAFTSLY
jgi:16S rRNA (adenine1518-N6/adenine1519-N6)-dimethyltransferase